MKVRFLIPLLLLLFLLLSCDKNSLNANKLPNNWEYMVGSEKDTIFSLDKTQFTELESLSHLENLLPGKEGYIWVRNSFTIPKNLVSTNIAILLGRITMADKTYLNNEFIGSGGEFPPEFFSNWNEFRFFPLPKSAINPGKTNELLIKIFIAGEGSITGELLLDSREKIEKIYKNSEFLNSNINIIISSILIVMSAYYFFMFFMRKKDKENLYFAILSISTSIYLTNFFISKIPGFESWQPSYISFQKVIFISVFISTYAFTFYIREFLNIEKINWQRNIILGVTIIPIVIYLFPRNYIVLRTITNYFQVLLLMPLSLASYYIIKSIIRKNRDTRILLVGISPFIITVLFDLITHQLLKMNSVIYITGFGMPIFLISNLFILSGRFVNYHTEVESLNRDLELKVEIRTRDLDIANKELESTLIKLEEKNKIAKKDMDMAETIQKNLFPKNSPQTDEWDSSFIFKPMSGVSGDLYDFYMENSRLLGVILLDVSGHGIASGLLTMIANTICRRIFFKTLSKPLSLTVDKINDDLIYEINNVDNYLTGIFLRFNGDYVEYVNAGHGDLLHKSGKTGKVTIINNSTQDFKGWFLGLEDMRQPYKALKFKVQKDDVLFLYTDGLNESKNSAGLDFGVEGVIEALSNSPNGSANEILNYIVDELYKFTGSNELNDDLTAIIVKKSGV
ncbi:MAG: SpoIIE family protein phosphatase [Spirochaetales bacterium]|nr:SpoIIE family protein phosphatase [Spirochaetales bacterium]